MSPVSDAILYFMPREALLEWEGREYDHNPKSADWYWALGIIAVAATVASVLFGNYLLAVLVIVAAIALALHAAKRPPLHRFPRPPRPRPAGEATRPLCFAPRA